MVATMASEIAMVAARSDVAGIAWEADRLRRAY
jgi:hypothetical protein